MSWNDAHEFCTKLSQQVAERGRRYRLPTEAEWEYAFRGGTTTTFYVGDSLTSHEGNFAANFPYGTDVVGPNVGRPAIVGSYPPNPFGLHDMIGNVCEWCQDACHGIPTYDAGVTLKIRSATPARDMFAEAGPLRAPAATNARPRVTTIPGGCLTLVFAWCWR